MILWSAFGRHLVSSLLNFQIGLSALLHIEIGVAIQFCSEREEDDER